MDFLKSHFSSLITYLEIMAFAISLFTFNKRQPQDVLRLFPFILFGIIIFEGLGAYLKVNHQNNNMVYNTLSPIYTLGYLYIVKEMLESDERKKIVLWLMWIYPTLILLDFYFYNSWELFNSRTIVAECLVLVIASVVAFFELSTVPTRMALRKTPLFWISCSILLFFLPLAVLASVYNFLPKEKQVISLYTMAFALTLKILNVFHYGLFSYAFICRLTFQT
jgi:hypothetical protein